MSRPPSAISPSLERNPDLDTWIAIERDGAVVLRSGKVEIGQGLVSAIARIGAEELDVSLEQVRVETADTSRGPNELVTAGSMSVEHSGGAIRQAAAEARQVLLELASERLGAPLGSLEVEEGVVRARGSQPSISYAELFGGQRFERRVTGEAVPKAPQSYRIVGKRGPRLDLHRKVTGGAFVHDLALPGMLHGAVVRPPHRSCELRKLDEGALRVLAGVVAVVRDGRFIGVIAEREEQALRARDAAQGLVEWGPREPLPDPARFYQELPDAETQSFLVTGGAPREGPVPQILDPASATTTLEASYIRPYQMHAAIAPSAALAHFEGDRLTVWSHSQSVELLRLTLAEALRVDPANVRVTHAAGPGCYGHNGADDVALDAALLARAVPGRPVRLQWAREDEHLWEPYAPAMAVELRASLDAAGKVIAWNHDSFGSTHIGRGRPHPEHSQLSAAWLLAEPRTPPRAQPILAPHAGIHRNADPYYSFPQRRVVKHFIAEGPMRTSSTRGLGALANVFAIESFMDELAERAGADPVAFRLAHLEDPRARAVIETASQRIGWPGERGNGRGLGLGFARYKNQQTYAAIAVELAADRGSGEIQLLRCAIAADAGAIVDPDGLANQLEGGFVQAASWTLREEVRFDRGGVRSRDWESYPILTFPEIPEIETVLLPRPHEPFLGAGEAASGPTPAAIGNALFRATGLRLRRIPFTPERVRESPAR